MTKLFPLLAFLCIGYSSSFAADTLYVQHFDEGSVSLQQFQENLEHNFSIENSTLKATINKGDNNYAYFSWLLPTAIDVTKYPFISFKAKSNMSAGFMIDVFDEAGKSLRYLISPTQIIKGGEGFSPITIDLTNQLVLNPKFDKTKVKNITIFTAAGKPFEGTVYFDSFKIGYNPAAPTGNINLAPELNMISSQSITNEGVPSMLNLSGINDGNDNEVQNITFTTTINNNQLISSLSLNYTPGSTTATLNYSAIPGKTGLARITINIKDDGSFSGDNVNFIERSFNVFVKDSNYAQYKQLFNDGLTPELIPGNDIKLSVSSNALLAAVDKISYTGISFVPSQTIDLSVLPNISIDLKSDSTFRIYAVLYDINDKEINLSNVTVVGGKPDYTKVGFNFKSQLNPASFDATQVKSITFFLNGGEILKDTIMIDNLYIGFDDATFKPTLPTGINLTNTSNYSLKLFPNPGNGLININWSSQNVENINIHINDNMGRNIKTYENVSTVSPKTLDLSDLENGLYYLQTDLKGQRSKVEKILINK